MAVRPGVLLALLAISLTPLWASAQTPEAVPNEAEESPWAFGQQHWFALHLSIFQPTTLRLQATAFRQPTRTWLAEAYIGSELFDFMVGGGGRVQYTAWREGCKDAVLISPGLGIHGFPQTSATLFSGRATTRTYLAADVDISWLHDFSPHFGYELGLKLGLGMRLSGEWDNPPGTMFSESAFPIVSVFSGFRF